MATFDEILKERRTGNTFDGILYQRKQKKLIDQYKNTDLTDIYEALSKDGYKDASSLSSYKSRMEKYRDIVSELDFDDKEAKQKYLTDLNSNIDVINNNIKHFSPFETEFDYNDYIMNNTKKTDPQSITMRKEIYESNATRIAELENQMAIEEKNIKKTPYRYGRGPMRYKVEGDERYNELKAEKERLEASNRKYERLKKTNDETITKYSGSEDWAEKSSKRDFYIPTEDDVYKYIAENDTSTWKQDENGNYVDSFGTVLNVEGNTLVHPNANKSEIEDPLGLFLSSEKGEQGTINVPSGVSGDFAHEYNRIISNGWESNWEQLNEDEINAYYYMLNSGLRDEALAYLEGMTTELNRRRTEELEGKINEAGGLALAIYNIGSVPANIIGGATAFVDDAWNTIQGKDINPYNSAHSMQNFGQTVRGETAGRLDEWTGDASLLGISLGDAYQGLMSGVDSAVGATTMGSAYSVVMGMGAASSTAKDLYERGASKGQIAVGGILAGTAEMLFEKISVGYFLDNFVNSPTKGFKNWALKTLAQSGIEATEEAATEIANILSDTLVMGSQSEWEQMLEQYKRDGLSDSEAIGKALGQMGLKVWEASAGGFISGGGMGAVGGIGGAVAGHQNTVARGEAIKDANQVEKLTEVAKTLGDKSKASKYADKITKQSSAYAIGKLYGLTEAELSKSNQADIVKSLERKGLDTKSAKEIAKIMLGDNGESTYGADVESKEGQVYNDLVKNPKSTVNTREEGLKEVLYGIAIKQQIDKINKATKEAERNEDIAKAEELKKSIKEGNKVSAEEGVSVKKIDSFKDGKVMVATDDGNVSDSNDVTFKTEDEAYIVLSTANLSNELNALGIDFDVESANLVMHGFDANGGVSASTYMLGARDAIRYGAIGQNTSALTEGGHFNELTKSQQKYLYSIGRKIAERTTKADEDKRKASMPKETAKADAKSTQTTSKNGKVTKPNVKLNETQSLAVEMTENLSKEGILKNNFYFFASKKGKTTINGEVVETRVFAEDVGIYKKGQYAPNGFYQDANGDVYIDLNSGVDGQGLSLYTLAHELGHFVKRQNPSGYKVLADFISNELGDSLEDLIKAKLDVWKRLGRKNLNYMDAYEDVICDALEPMFTDGHLAEKLVNYAKTTKEGKGLIKTLMDFFRDLAERIKKAYSKLSPDDPAAVEMLKREKALLKASDLFAKALVGATDNKFANADIVDVADVVGGNVDLDGDSNSHIFSDRTIVEGAGLRFIPDKDGVHYKVLDRNGKAVKNVTPEMMINSPLGNLVTMAKTNGFLGKGKESTIAAQKQYEFLAELVNMCINYNGLAPIWETAGTMVFSSIKSNADKQYGLTIDFSTVCKKTQAVVDAMSEAMVRLGRGLTRSEVETIYLEVGKAGESTPCPVCYVFSRWMGIGGILDQMNRFQDKYYNMSEAQLQAFISDIKQRIEERANTPNAKGKLKSEFFDKNGAIKEGQVIADLKQKANSKAGSTLNAITKNADIQLQIQELEVLMENQDSKEAKKTAKAIEKLKAKVVDVSELESQFKHYNDVVEEYEAYQWLTRTLMKEENGNWVKNKKFKPVPSKVLFDLNKGAEFAENYPLSWAFRTGKGASAGKAITPYADARVGEAIQGIASGDVKSIKTGIDLNPFINGNTKARLEILKKAIEKQARQNLIGGQRYQSTSDFRYEYGSDYLITFLEMQAIGAKVQLYTKVIEAVDFLATMGADVNLSVMPLSNGFVTLPNGKKKLIYSSVTGIDADAAISKAHEYNNVQLILVGISDEHIRLALEGDDVTFVIPFHGSGNTVHQIQVLMNLLGENLDVTTAQDYTAVQSDHISPNRTKEQKAMWDLRVNIIMGKASKLSETEWNLLNKNAYLKDLYRRFYVDKSAEEYGIKLGKDQAEQIFPYEYWDKSLTYAEADQNGERFKEYCASMGIIPRFSGMNSKGESVGYGDFTNDKGYWKLLIDRKMYDNTYDSNGNWSGYGKYHIQQRINCSNFQVKHLDPEWGSATYGDVMSKANDPKKTNAIVDRAIAQFENNADTTLHNDRVIQPITETEYKDLEKHFGTTGNFKAAGYLLTNGNLLDFSGKHWGDTTSRMRQVDHREAQEVLNRGNNGINDMIDMIGNGNIRLMPEIGGINLAVYPNEKQRRVLSVYINYMLNTEGQIVIDYDSVGGDTVHSRTYGKTATSRQILNDIRNYFNGARQSELMSFHAMGDDILFSDRILMGSLFSGGGTLEAGLVYQMLDKEFAVEYNRKIASAYTDNYGKEHMFVGDVRDFNSKEKQNVFYLHASPVCKNFSAASHSSGETTIDITTAQATARVLEEQMPQVFTVENVKRYKGSEAYNIITNKLDELGYTWDVDVYKASDYGNATKRERMIIRAVKNGELPAKPQKVDNIVSWGEATRDLWETDLIPSNLVRSKIDAIKNTPSLKGINLTKLDKPLMIYDTTKGKTITYAWADELAPTLTTKCGDARIIMPNGRVYAPTPKFMGRIQGLPDDYKYPKSTTRAFTIIGNGIPTQLTKSVIGGVLDSAYEQTHEGQTLFSDRDIGLDTRTLLANALESTAQNPTEKDWLGRYKAQIASLNADQERLDKINAEIKEISFTKGKDRTKLPELKNNKKTLEDRILRTDKQLLKIEASKVLKNVLEKEKALVWEKARAKAREERKTQRETAAQTLRDTMNMYNERIKTQREGRNKTEMRHKIRKVVGDLRTLLNRGTKERNVKIGLQDTVSKALATAEILFSEEISNADIVRLGVDSVTPNEQKYLTEYATLLDMLDEKTINAGENVEIARIRSRISKLNSLLKDVFIRERARLNRENVSNAMNSLAEAYMELRKSEDAYIKENAFVQGMYERIVNLAEDLKGVTIKDMNLQQLTDVYKMYSMVKHMVTKANSIFREGRYEDLSQLISLVQGEIDSIKSSDKDKLKAIAKVEDFVNSFTWNELKPLYAFERLGSDTFKKLFWDIIEADNVWAKDIEEAGKVIEDARKKYGYKKWDTKAVKAFKSANGLEFKLTLADMMSIYAYSKRPQAEDHMTIGGFAFDENNVYKEKKKGINLTYKHAKLSETYKVDITLINQIMKELSKIEGVTEYVDEVQGYLTKLGEKGNEVSRELFGIDLFKEKAYFPLKSATDYRSSIEQALNATPTMASLKNTGIAKETVPHASNPIVLQGFDDIVLDHINTMSKYHAYVIPIENISKVFNNVGKDEINGDYIATKALITSKFGESAKKYFDQFITDLNGGAFGGGAENPLAKFFGTAKAVSVSANLSVVVQQYFSVVRAMDEINPKYFTPFLNGEASKSEQKQWDELKKYSPIAIIKEIGGVDMGLNRSAIDYMGDAETKVDAERVGKKVKEGSMWLAGKMDEIGWSTIWRAVKKEIADTTKLTPGTEEFFQACSKRFTEIIVKTQVYDSISSRSGYMRSKHESVKYLTSFMGEPTTIVNMMFSKQLAFARAIKAKDSKAIKEASKKLARTSGVIILSTVLTSLAKSLPYAMRDDEEEDEALMERWAKHFGESLASDMNPLNMIPIGRDLVSIWEGWDVERPDMTLIADVFDTIKKAIDDGMTWEEAMNLAGSLSNILGYPLKNVIRDGKGIIRLFGDIFDDNSPDDMGGAFSQGFSGKSDKEFLLDRFTRTGDRTFVKNEVADMLKQKTSEGKTQKEARTAVRQSFIGRYREEYIKGNMTKRNNIRRLLYATGLWDSLSELDELLAKWRKESK